MERGTKLILLSNSKINIYKFLCVPLKEMFSFNKKKLTKREKLTKQLKNNLYYKTILKFCKRKQERKQLWDPDSLWEMMDQDVKGCASMFVRDLWNNTYNGKKCIEWVQDDALFCNQQVENFINMKYGCHFSYKKKLVAIMKELGPLARKEDGIVIQYGDGNYAAAETEIEGYTRPFKF
tara:strand:- start:11 stop:547 length:537 start_codon:yes stop_codon:yes gene_type:complete